MNYSALLQAGLNEMGLFSDIYTVWQFECGCSVRPAQWMPGTFFDKKQCDYGRKVSSSILPHIQTGLCRVFFSFSCLSFCSPSLFRESVFTGDTVENKIIRGICCEETLQRCRGERLGCIIK